MRDTLTSLRQTANIVHTRNPGLTVKVDRANAVNQGYTGVVVVTATATGRILASVRYSVKEADAYLLGLIDLADYVVVPTDPGLYRYNPDNPTNPTAENAHATS